MDYSRAVAIHRLYGHNVFVIEATKSGKDETFIKNICRSNSLKCLGQELDLDWRGLRIG